MARKKKIGALQIALFAGEVIDMVADIDQDSDGKLSPAEIADAATETVVEAARAFPGFINLSGDPDKLRRAAELQAEFIRLVTS